MKKITILCLCLLMSRTAPTVAGDDAQGDFQAFWQQFKTAIISGDKEAVAGLSGFPIGMSYGLSDIKDSAELGQRYSEVFNEQTTAAQCFAGKVPEKEAGNPGRFTVACPNEAGQDVVIYEFERTTSGWRFVRLDNINE